MSSDLPNRDDLAHDTPMADPSTVFKDKSDDEWMWLNVATATQDSTIPDLVPSDLREMLPTLPEEAIQYRFTGRAGATTLEEAYNIFKRIKQSYEQYRGPLTEAQHVLDFGCGWGRIIRFFLKDVAGRNLEGIDCFPEAIEISQATNRWAQFSLIDPMPPTTLASDTYDLIYSYSVFSHLSEAAHIAWFREFHRLLQPGGMLIVTTRAREFIEFCEQIRQMNPRPDWAQDITLAFDGVDRWLDAYDRGEFCHEATGGGDVLSDSFYGESAIPRQYIEDHWSKDYHIRDFIVDREHYEQNFIVLQKR